MAETTGPTTAAALAGHPVDPEHTDAELAGLRVAQLRDLHDGLMEVSATLELPAGWEHDVAALLGWSMDVLVRARVLVDAWRAGAPYADAALLRLAEAAEPQLAQVLTLMEREADDDQPAGA